MNQNNSSRDHFNLVLLQQEQQSTHSSQAVPCLLEETTEAMAEEIHEDPHNEEPTLQEAHPFPEVAQQPQEAKYLPELPLPVYSIHKSGIENLTLPRRLGQLLQFPVNLTGARPNQWTVQEGPPQHLLQHAKLHT